MDARHRKNPPRLWLMTDERVDAAALIAAAERLPRGGAGIVFRHYRTAAAERRALFQALRRVARRRRLVLMLGGTAQAAAAWRADGAHGRDARRAARPMLRSRPVHDATEALAARGADVVFVSPLFPTRSHPGAHALGRARFAALARQSAPPVIALGGVRPCHRRLLRGIGADGWAAIDGLTLQDQSTRGQPRSAASFASGRCGLAAKG
ncbi:thiamine phosphate synthase [Sphingobium amiense]|uniref:Thiamine phosphate synthase n=1 Tax=Sphingobium amiense TaxID=135719 RepID=A0A494WFJ9_9SPHN|nr:thiamine phosphate synthase [Sphingobium amiense]BBD99399.1 thiamine phosphate synthase [Sphingobium amiense]